MQIAEVRGAVLAAIEAVAPGTDWGQVRTDQPLRPQIDLDSLDWLNVIAELHKRLSIDIPEPDHGELATLDAMVHYAAARVAHPQFPAARPAPDAAAPLPRTQRLINATAVTVRPVRADDLPLEADFVRRLSSEARYERFMVTVNELPPDKLVYLTDVDQVRHVALAATVEREAKETAVGVVRYVVDASGSGCEFAIAIDDAWQRSGLAGILMHMLIDVARARGLSTMEGLVLPTNARMLKFTRQLGFRQQRDPGDRDTVRVVLAL